jgi:hypothetical protein
MINIMLLKKALYFLKATNSVLLFRYHDIQLKMKSHKDYNIKSEFLTQTNRTFAANR